MTPTARSGIFDPVASHRRVRGDVIRLPSSFFPKHSCGRVDLFFDIDGTVAIVSQIECRTLQSMKKANKLAKGVSGSGGEPSDAGLRKRSGTDLAEIQQLVGELGPGDGIDPRLEAKRRSRAADASRPGLAHEFHKQERFLAQVQEAIDSALPTAVTPVLNSLTVREVVKQGGSLLVVVVPRNPDEPLDLAAATKALKQATSMLAREVASAITRKNVPNLSFIVLPAGAQKIDG